MPHPSSHPPRVRFRVHPKSNGVRVISRLEPALAAAYASVGVRVAPAVEGRLRAGVLADRVASTTEVPPAVMLRDWRLAAGRFRSAAGSVHGAVVRTDVAECYRSIAPDIVADALARCGVGPSTIARCVRTLRELQAEGVDGLPVGPPASAVLANAVLATGDDALTRSHGPFLRWVDDWCIPVRSDHQAADVLGRLAEALQPVGLRLNDAKTRVMDASELAGWPGVAQYHRAAHAHPLPIVTGADAVVPGEGGVGAGGRPTRRAGRQR